jgi:hypothetical protein
LKSIDTILVIFPYCFRDFDRKRFEIECLKRYTNVVVHDLSDALHPHFSEAYHVFDTSSDVLRFSSVLEWKEEYLDRIKSYKGKVYVINFVSVTTFKELFVNYILSSSNVFLIKYNNPGVSTYGCIDEGFFSKIRTKYFFIVKRASFKWFVHAILLSRLLIKLNLFLCRKNDFILSVDKKFNNFSSKVILSNSFDYSMAVKKNKSNNNNNGVIVYLDTGAPLFKTDSFLLGNKQPLTKELWYPSLINFFNIIENKTLNKVVIAAHPKHKYSAENKHCFGARHIIHGDTMNLVSQASLVLVTNSTAVSYAVMFNKPVLVLLSNELIEDGNILLKESNHLSSILGCPTINVDKINESLLSNFSINTEKYLTYKNKYLSSRLDSKTNCEIIINEIINCNKVT